MDIRPITDVYFVAPQIDPSDMEALRAQGFSLVICNRPDEEVPVSHQCAAMQSAAEAAGLAFVALPLTHQTFTPERIGAQRDAAAAADGKVLAYCASGTRSTIAWAIGAVGGQPVDAILDAARRAGYELENIRPTLEAAAAARP